MNESMNAIFDRFSSDELGIPKINLNQLKELWISMKLHSIHWKVLPDTDYEEMLLIAGGRVDPEPITKEEFIAVLNRASNREAGLKWNMEYSI